MDYNPIIHQRRSIRIQGYNYSQNGAYYITLCLQNREHLFGEIVKEKMVLNAAGEMIDYWWQELKNKYSSIDLDTYIVMPNHFHGIIIIRSPVGADLCVRPDMRDNREGIQEQPTVEKTTTPCPLDISPPLNIFSSPLVSICEPSGQTRRSAPTPNVDHPTIGTMIQWFKTMTTNAYIKNVNQNNWPSFSGRLWQRNYYERIIRDEDELDRVREYITENPKNWRKDDLFMI